MPAPGSRRWPSVTGRLGLPLFHAGRGSGLGDRSAGADHGQADALLSDASSQPRPDRRFRLLIDAKSPTQFSAVVIESGQADQPLTAASRLVAAMDAESGA